MTATAQVTRTTRRTLHDDAPRSWDVALIDEAVPNMDYGHTGKPVRVSVLVETFVEQEDGSTTYTVKASGSLLRKDGTATDRGQGFACWSDRPSRLDRSEPLDAMPDSVRALTVGPDALLAADFAGPAAD